MYIHTCTEGLFNTPFLQRRGGGGGAGSVENLRLPPPLLGGGACQVVSLFCLDIKTCFILLVSLFQGIWGLFFFFLLALPVCSIGHEGWPFLFVYLWVLLLISSSQNIPLERNPGYAYDSKMYLKFVYQSHLFLCTGNLHKGWYMATDKSHLEKWPICIYVRCDGLCEVWSLHCLGIANMQRAHIPNNFCVH